MNNYFAVVLNLDFLKMTIGYIDFTNLNLQGIITEQSDKLKVQINNFVVPCYSFTQLRKIARENDSVHSGGAKFLLIGYRNHLEDQRHVAEVLATCGTAKEDIINFTIWFHMLHLKRMKYVLEEQSENLDFIATGISYMEAGLDVSRFNSLRGINLVLSGQDLWHGYHIIEQVLSRRKLRFCLLGLSPYSFRYDISKSFSANFYAYHYQIFMNGFDEDFPHRRELQSMFNEKFYSVWDSVKKVSEEERQSVSHMQTGQIMGCNDFCSYMDAVKAVKKKYYPATVRKNVSILHNCLKICRQYGVEPIMVVFPFAKLLRENFDKAQLENFRLILSEICRKYQARVIDLFDYKLEDDCFFDMAHLNQNGARIVSDVIYANLIK